ncbi:type II secretion system protein J [Pedobacter sp. AJM]|uniref:PulJ/GspJ family protein n=1 Tax=Pedobacter sp. AJM TaxID=2003629 RepID=UPI000B4C1DCB|nr:prepilin-type N-terminal cleavage/methylation domain-containing protein [Pedobacter sp. AJM]OWK68849.1 hypothetical protein CBW18_19760 [Pedobacter sp. AJM]
MAGLINKRLEGSTLVEVLIALVIIMAVFTIATAVFSNVLNSGVSMRRIQVNAQMEELRLHFLDTIVVDEQRLYIDSIEYHVSFLDSASASVTRVEISATDHGKSAGKIQFLKAIHPDAKKD